ncbi:MAG: D-2-hydroxyacid dehydrogenase [Verrucomicrobia bacterium]|nr:MAG: D-2-hydroxyacid dehydrogenase [Verrucomicrobiota bacterium]
MNIVVLDGHTLNPGDLSWGELQSLGECRIYDRTPPDEVVKRAADAEIVLTNKTVLTREQIHSLPKLRYIGVLATGYNIVDIAAAREGNIPVTNVPTYGTRSVAQHTLALLLELTQHVGHHARTVRDGRWTNCPDFCYWDYPLIELDGLTMGIVGLGRIGGAVAELAKAFRLNLLATSSTPGQSSPGIQFVELESLFRQSDVVSLHCPLTPRTNNLVNAKRLALMKPTAFLLNTSRGGLVEEQALADALNSGRIAGAAVDVLSLEPPPADNPLLRAKNCLVTPHIAWATRAARSRLLATAVANVRAFLDGRAQNVVT